MLSGPAGAETSHLQGYRALCRNGDRSIRNAHAAPRQWRKGDVQQGDPSLLHGLLQMSHAGCAEEADSLPGNLSQLFPGIDRSLMGSSTGFLASALWVFYFLDIWRGKKNTGGRTLNAVSDPVLALSCCLPAHPVLARSKLHHSVQ